MGTCNVTTPQFWEDPVKYWASTPCAPITQNQTATPNAAGMAFLPWYGIGTQYMTESIGCGIITSVTVSMSANMLLRRTAGADTGWSNWVFVAAVNSAVYTITTVMMSQSSGLFNPAFLFGYAIMGRITWAQWIILSLANIVGSFMGALISYLQVLQQMCRVPTPKRLPNGDFVYIEVNAWRLWRLGKHPLKTWGDADRNHVIREKNIESWAMRIVHDKEHWLGKNSDDDRDEVLGQLVDPSVRTEAEPSVGANGPKAAEEGNGAAAADQSDNATAHLTDGAYRAELIKDRRRKLICFCESPIMWSPFFIYPVIAHIMAGTTAMHWTSFITGTASQGTNTNAYLVQAFPARDNNGLPGQTIAWQVMVSEAWLMFLVYFLLSVSAGAPNYMILNPAIDLGGRLVHWLFPIANKGSTEWDYAWVPFFIPFVGATIAAAMMYLGMWAHFGWPWTPYGTMRV
ncbi:hypothetical protein DFJ74DRAFT_665793 [Hyaloraphidium curvatum]|nr:hypothetical protein DFJ74DRAFT_665793 [Hyaloraphidium curvatum]